jgi:hypothetical protein
MNSHYLYGLQFRVSDVNLEEDEVLKPASFGIEANNIDTVDIIRKSVVILISKLSTFPVIIKCIYDGECYFEFWPSIEFIIHDWIPKWLELLIHHQGLHYASSKLFYLIPICKWSVFHAPTFIL